jgi:catechol 2,3-dioxygenase-like lactoylglutathione lyase family enzyme
MLGFTLERRYRLEAIPAEIAMIRNGALHVELFQVPDPQPKSPERSVPDDDVRTVGNKHVAFSVVDVRTTLEGLRAKGADIVWLKELSNGRAAAFIRDNEGNLIEFVQWPKVGDPTAVLPGES